MSLAEWHNFGFNKKLLNLFLKVYLKDEKTIYCFSLLILKNLLKTLSFKVLEYV